MLFEWDEAKSRRNLSERGFGFDYANKTTVETTAKSGCRPLDKLARMFCSSSHRNARHIISARLASRKERKSWHSFVEQWRTSGG